jgi:hypothetical protein
MGWNLLILFGGLMPVKTHYLKTWPEYFAEIADGDKTFELRKNDRDFESGDVLVLQEWSPESKEYTGRETTKMVGYLLQGEFGLPDDICVMSLLPAK